MVRHLKGLDKQSLLAFYKRYVGIEGHSKSLEGPSPARQTHVQILPKSGFPGSLANIPGERERVSEAHACYVSAPGS